MEFAPPLTPPPKKKHADKTSTSLAIELHSIALCSSCFVCVCVVFNKLKVCDNLASKQAYQHHFPPPFVRSTSLSHFGNSHCMSSFLIILIIVMVILDATLPLFGGPP